MDNSRENFVTIKERLTAENKKALMDFLKEAKKMGLPGDLTIDQLNDIAGQNKLVTFKKPENLKVEQKEPPTRGVESSRRFLEWRRKVTKESAIAADEIVSQAMTEEDSDPVNAKKLYEQALRVDPNNVEALINIASLMLSQKNLVTPKKLLNI